MDWLAVRCLREHALILLRIHGHVCVQEILYAGVEVEILVLIHRLVELKVCQLIICDARVAHVEARAHARLTKALRHAAMAVLEIGWVYIHVSVHVEVLLLVAVVVELCELIRIEEVVGFRLYVWRTCTGHGTIVGEVAAKAELEW